MARAVPSEASTRPRDSQRARLYRAEGAVDSGRRLPTALARRCMGPGTAQRLEDAFDRERVRWTLAQVPA